jgi:hypothetical protein
MMASCSSLGTLLVISRILLHLIAALSVLSLFVLRIVPFLMVLVPTISYRWLSASTLLLSFPSV